LTRWKGILKGYKLASNEDFEKRTPKAYTGCLRSPIIEVFDTRVSWRRDEKGGLPPLEKGVFVGNCAREKKKKKKKKRRPGKERNG